MENFLGLNSELGGVVVMVCLFKKQSARKFPQLARELPKMGCSVSWHPKVALGP